MRRREGRGRWERMSSRSSGVEKTRDLAEGMVISDWNAVWDREGLEVGIS